MKFTATPLAGAYVINLEPVNDERGFFARSCCEREFTARGLTARFVQCGISFNQRRGTLRGMHYQDKPHEEIKLVRCTQGAVYDVIVDLRAPSPTYRKWFGLELSARNRRLLYVPPGCAHGFETLVDDTEVFYQISEFYRPQNARGVRWDDPAFAIEWPESVQVISARDQSYPDFSP